MERVGRAHSALLGHRKRDHACHLSPLYAVVASHQELTWLASLYKL